jgi:FAD/FMN-containing dehydrogenase
MIGSNKSRRQFLAYLSGLTLGGVFSTAAQTKAVSAEMPPEHERAALHLDGTVHWRGEPEYEGLRQGSVWQALKPERYPDVIVQAASEADIVKAIGFARARRIPVTVKGGGHSFIASHLRDGGVLLDVSRLHSVEIDATARIARVGPGVRSGEFAYVLGNQGLAFPVPHGVSVPLGGYLLGGGMGWNNTAWKDFGCFSVRAVEMVLASGERITADPQSYPELFWAARGAGPAFFAVVTRYHLDVYPLPRAITACTYVYPLRQIEALIAWLDHPDLHIHPKVELSLILQKDKVAADHTGGFEANCVVSAVAFADSDDEARTLLGEILRQAPMDERVVANDYRQMTFQGLLELSRILVPQRMANDTCWADQTGAAMRLLAGHIETAPGDSEAVIIMNLRANVDIPDDAAYSVVAPLFVNLATMWDKQQADGENQGWMDAAITLLDPVTTGSYINESDFLRRPERASLYMSPENWKRLEALRRRNDPLGVFPAPMKINA